MARLPGSPPGERRRRPRYASRSLAVEGMQRHAPSALTAIKFRG